MKKIYYYIIAIISYLFIRIKKYRKKSDILYKEYYSESKPYKDPNPMMIFMTDKNLSSGGLADRLRGIVSVFDFCLKKNIDFKIYFTEPFILSDYLLPNQYDWTIQENQISYNSKDSYPIFLIPHKEKILNNKIESKFQNIALKKLIKHKQPQLHVYTNALFGDKSFGKYFNILFKPSFELSKILEREKKNLGTEYISVSTRFLELLGDFTEPERMRETLDEENQLKLIESCITQIIIIKNQYLPINNKMLITSDSKKFLDAAKKLDFCYVVEGNISHLEAYDASKIAHMKTFTDFLLISQAKRAFLLLGTGMYSSNFSKRASMINNIPFQIIEF